MMMNLQMNKVLLARLVKIQRRLRLTKGYVHQDSATPTRDASELFISSVLEKLNREGSYSIGGTCTEADLWFHFTTSCYGETNLLNLFVRVVWPGRYKIKYVSNRKLILRENRSSDLSYVIIGYGDLEERSFRTTQENEEVYLKTYEFKHCDILTNSDQALVIPIGITNTAPISRLNYSMRRLLDTRLESADFSIISNTNLKHRIHSMALEEHSPMVLKKQMYRALDDYQTSLFLDINDHEIKALIEFIYCYNIENSCYDFMELVKLVPKFGLTKLYNWVKNNVRNYICYTNAYEIGKLAVKHEWKEILPVLFECVEDSPEILYAFGQKDEVDRTLLKELLRHMYDG